jgi:transcriptional regulator with XRE-family HTH domain
MTLGSKLLSEWRAKAKLSQTDASGRFGVSQPGYRAWERGTVPKVEQALHIEKVTQGAVPVASWGVAFSAQDSSTDTAEGAA